MNSIVEKLTRSWQLFRSSVGVIRTHPKLLVFPLVTGVLTFAIAVFFLAPVILLLSAPAWLHGTALQSFADRFAIVRFNRMNMNSFNFQIQPMTTALMAGLYLLNLFLATFCSVAFNSQILEALSGRTVSIRQGFEAAFQRWKQILFWSLLAGTVGLIIRAIEERFAFLGRLVAGMIGLAWSVAAIFAIPVLIREPELSNPFDVLMRSARMLKQTWGETLAGYLGMQGANLVVLWGSILFWIATGASAFLFKNPWILLAAGIPWLGCLFVYSYLSSIASRVYLCALYVYAAEGRVPGPFDSDSMSAAFRHKK